MVVAIVSLASTVAVLASDRQKMADEVLELKSIVDDHELRVRVVEKLVIKASTDIAWIRKDLESRPR